MKLTVAQLVMKSPPFMEPEDSLPCSQDPATGQFPEPVKSIPQLNGKSKVVSALNEVPCHEEVLRE
jgi:hypothetical protein